MKSVPPMVKYFLGGVAAVALLAGIGFYLNRGSQVRLEGKVVKVRTVRTDDAASIAIVEVRITNPANVRFVVEEVLPQVTLADGRTVTGDPVNQLDLDRILDYYKGAGPRFNEALKMKSNLAGRASSDWTIGASFPVSETELKSRKSLAFEILDVDGAKARIDEAPPQ